MEDPKERHPKPPFPKRTTEHPGLESEIEPRPDYGADSYEGHGRLRDRVALITGADSGIGRAVALAFAREGADVSIAYSSEHSDAEETYRIVTSAGRRALLLPGDISDEQHCGALVQQTTERLGRLDILVNNAAYQGKSVERFEELEDERVRRTFSVNIIAMFNLVRRALPHLGPGCSIINVASIQAYHPSPGIIDYAATKGAIVAFTKALAESLAERGIRVNAVAPGPVWTPLIAQSFPAEKVSGFGKNSPMTRPAQPAELAPAFVFLASSEASYVSGEVLGVTGGKPLM